MTEIDARLQSRHHISGIWLVPLVAVALGLWLLYDTYRSKGPTVQIRFATADGIEIDKTRVRFRNVPLGQVSDIELDESLQGVWITVAMAPAARPLLREDTRFWVVRPRVQGTSISGLGTIVSGAYIELDPGTAAATQERKFQGLEDIPLTSSTTQGLRVRLLSEHTGSLGTGDPVLYRGYTVGVVESAHLDVDTQQVSYSAFIHAPYDRLVTTGTRFWNASGISAQLSSEGVKMQMGSLQSLIAGGVAFDLPEGGEAGTATAMDEVFRLYPDRASIEEDPHAFYEHFVILATQSLRGLNPGAAVTYRGIRVGSVIKIMLPEFASAHEADASGRPIPVLIRIEPAALGIGDSSAAVERLRELIPGAIDNGLRATLESGSLLTGALFVDLNFYPDQEPQPDSRFEGHTVIPTIAGSFGQIQHQVTRLLKKFNDLELADTVTAANGALRELRGTLAELRRLVASDGTRALPATLNDALAAVAGLLRQLDDAGGLPGNINRSLIELNATLRSLQGLSDTLQEKPNSVIFPIKHEADPMPRSGR